MQTDREAQEGTSGNVRPSGAQVASRSLREQPACAVCSAWQCDSTACSSAVSMGTKLLPTDFLEDDFIASLKANPVRNCARGISPELGQGSRPSTCCALPFRRRRSTRRLTAPSSHVRCLPCSCSRLPSCMCCASRSRPCAASMCSCGRSSIGHARGGRSPWALSVAVPGCAEVVGGAAVAAVWALQPRWESAAGDEGAAEGAA